MTRGTGLTDFSRSSTFRLMSILSPVWSLLLLLASVWCLFCTVRWKQFRNPTPLEKTLFRLSETDGVLADGRTALAKIVWFGLALTSLYFLAALQGWVN